MWGGAPPQDSRLCLRRLGQPIGSALVCRRCPRKHQLCVRAAKRVKGGKGGSPKGGTATAPIKLKSPGQVKEGAAYKEETRKMILTLNHVSKTAPNGKQILKDVGLGMYLGAKIGFLGANGAGKSSLMRVLAGQDSNYEGQLQLADGMHIGYLEQEPKLDDGPTVEDNIRPALARVQSLLDEYNQVADAMSANDVDTDKLMARMDRLQTAIDAAQGWELERQLERATEALRCPPGESEVAVLSGGERRRVALARVLLEAPDILLLDEPTNHLDAESVAWLERTLAAFRGTVVAITHDRFFLDNVAGWILELDKGAGIPFEGNYSDWLAAKAERLGAEKRANATVQRQLTEELEWVRSRAKGQQKKGKARMRRYEDLVQQAEQYSERDTLDHINIPIGPRLGNVVVEARGLCKAFGERLLLDDVSFIVPAGSIVGIVGPNGTGKSTLFRMIVGEDKPNAGELVVGETVVPMYVDQSRSTLSDARTVFEEVGGGEEDMDMGGRRMSVRAYLSWFNFKGADQQKPMSALSGGERNRLHLAKVLRQSGNLLLLDEPTNDLDVDTLRALEDAVRAFAGSALVISHDRWFLDRIATHILAFEGDSQVKWFEGGYTDYEADLRQRRGGADPTQVKYRRMAMLN